MTITGGSALPKEEIDRMVKEAEAHAAEDKARREEAETRNSAEQLVYSTEKLLADNADKLPEDVTTDVKAAVGELRTALEGTDVEQVKAKQAALVTVSQRIGEALYSANQAADAAAASDGTPGTDGQPSSAKADDDIVDAEIVEEDEAK
jgi:molecular chaperone DnaK